ncbi:MAG: filamentous hemagglutinin family protein [Pseudomonadota bacterium]
MPPRVVASRSAWRFHAALLASVSALALLTSGAPARALPLGTMRGGSGAFAASANAAAAAMASVQQAQQATQQSMSNLTRAVQAVQAMQQTQAQARALAQQATSAAPGLPSVPNGLTPGGLVPTYGLGPYNAQIPDPSVWSGANAATQSVSNGQTTVTVQQTAQKAILTWTSFNVGANTELYFNQSAGNLSGGGNNWIALNRVIDPSGVPSQILGQIKAEGTVYIINHNGIVFGGSSQVNVNSLLASSLPFMGDPANLTTMTPGSAAYDTAVEAANSEFLNAGITGYGTTGTPFLGTTIAALADVESEGNISVEAGAQINAGNLGYALLAAPDVSNAGTIFAADGQAVLAAGMGVTLQTASGDAPNSWLGLGLTGAVTSGATPIFTATNTGLLQATTGNVTMLGAAVDQAGVIKVTTSITQPGEIVLNAGDEELSSGIANANRMGPLVFAPGSVTTVLPDDDDETTTSTQAANASFKPGSMSLIGGSVIFDNGSLVEAPGGNVTAVAQFPAAGNPAGIDGEVLGRVYVDSGAVIDVSGLPDVEEPVSSTLVTIGPLTTDDLADSPLQRNGFLFTQTVVIDSTITGTRADGEAWVGSPLIDAQGYVNAMPRTIDEMLVNAGSLDFAGGEIITAPGSVLNMTGGYIHYIGGMVATTRLLDASGNIINIANADPNDTFVGFAGNFEVDHAHWGVTDYYGTPLLLGGYYQPDYIQGGNGGALNIYAGGAGNAVAISGSDGAMILDGEIFASSEIGPHQALGGDLPTGGSLSIGDGTVAGLGGDISPTSTLSAFFPTQNIVIAGQGTQLDAIAPNFNADTSLVTPAYQAMSQSDPNNVLYTSTFSAPIFDAAGFSSMSFVAANANLAVNAPLNVQAGGKISLSAAAVQVNADLTARGGAINIVGTSYSSPPPGEELSAGDVTVGPGVTISAAGQWVNDAGLGLYQQTGSANINGGSISITTDGNSYPPFGQSAAPGTSITDITGAIDLEQGSVLDVSSGGYVEPNGTLDAVDGIPVGKGGSISLQTYVFKAGEGFGNYAVSYLPPDQPTHGIITLDGTLRGFGFSGGGTLTLQTLGIQIGGDPASAPSYDLVLPADFFSSQGFGAYNLTALYDATITSGTIVTVSEKNFVPNITALMTAPTGANLYGTGGALPDGSLVSVGSLDPYHRQAANFSLTSEEYMGWSTDNGADGNNVISPPVYAGVTGTLLLGQGAAILADPGASVSLTSYDQLTDLGTIVARGGSISLTGAPADSTPNGAPATGLTSGAAVESTTSSVWLGADSVLDASGIVLLDPSAAAVLTSAGPIIPRTGKVLAGGSVSVLDGFSYVIAEAGSVIDVSGASGTFDIAQSAGGLRGIDYVPTPVWSNAGSITLGGGSGLLYDGTLMARGGSAEADGGTLTLSPVAMSVLNDLPNLVGSKTTIASGIILQQSGTFVPVGLQPGQAITGYTVGTELFAVDRLDGSGIDSLVVGDDPVAAAENTFAGASTLNEPVPVGFAGNISINLGRSFVSDATEYVALAAGATSISTLTKNNSVGGTTVSISAPYVDFGGATFESAPVAAVADGALSVHAGTLDLTGQIALENFGNANFVSSGDTRLYDLTYGVASIPDGELFTGGNLTFQAAQLYPATANTFIIDAAGPIVNGAQSPTTVTFLPGGTASSIPLSAGGSLLIDATNIVQDGTVRVPLGTLVLGVNDTASQAKEFNNLPLVATQSVSLGAGSVTSVSLDGATVPYGTTVDGLDWQYQIYGPASETISFPDLTAPPAKSISLSGNDVALDPGATVDLSGGGTVYASEWVSGTGGSRNLLLQSNTVYASGATPTQVPLYPDDRPIYAVIPGYNSPVAPIDEEMTPDGAAVGSQVYLSGVAGLPAGIYTLLPGQYATMPGAYRVVQQTGSVNPLASQNTVLPDGSGIAEGYFVDGLTGAHSAQTTSFLVQSAVVWGQYSQYTRTNANSYFASQAAEAGTAVPRLPRDAGQLALAASNALTLGATLQTQAGAGGQGALVDIASRDIQITGNGEAALPGYLQISADALDGLGAASLLIGGTRSQTSAGETVDVAANSVVVSNDAADPLTGPEVILVTKTDPSNDDPNAPIGLLVESGSVIEAKGSSAETPETIIIGQDANSTTGAAAVSGDGALLAVSQNGILSIVRNDLPASSQGLLTIQGGVTLAGGAGLTLDASGNTLVDPTATLGGQAIAADSGLITFIPGSAAPGLSGMVIGADTLAQFASANEVILRSYGAIDFEGNINVDVANNLELSAGSFTDGAAGDAGNVAIHAGVLTLSNDLDALAPTSPVAGTSSLILTGNEIDFGSAGQGASTSAFSGFGSVAATAVNGIVGQGGGTFNFGALPVTLTAPVIIAGAGGNATLKTTGVLVLNSAPAAGTTSAAGAFGGAITLIGGAVADNTLIQVPAGNVTLEATSGDLDVNDNVDVSGFVKQFIDTAAYAPAGNIALTADAGNVNVAANVALDFAGASAGGTAGAVTLSAPKGNVNLAGVLQGGAVAGYQGGSFTLNTGGAVDLDALAATLASSGVNKLISVTTGAGNLMLSAGNNLTAANVILTANGGTAPSPSAGNVVIDGTINVSGPAAGEIGLFGKSGVDLEGGLYAVSLTPAQAGGVVNIGTTGTPDGTLNATYGYENVQAADSGTIHVGSGAVIDVSGGAGTLFGGTISFRAPLLANGDVNIAIDNGATLIGARAVTIEPYAVWSTTDNSTNAAQHFDGIIDSSGYYQDSNDGAPQYVAGNWTDASGDILPPPTDAATLAAYQANDYFVPNTPNADHQSFYGYVDGNAADGAGTLMAYVEKPGYTFGNRYAGIANVQIAPGIVLENPDAKNNGGAISIMTNWNLGAGKDDGAGNVNLVYRYNGIAPVLSVLATGNLDIEASITDGFYQQNGGVKLADPIAAPLSSYDAVLAAYNATYTYLQQDSTVGNVVWNGQITDPTVSIYQVDLSGVTTGTAPDPYYQALQAPLKNQTQAYYNNYAEYIANWGSGQTGFAVLTNNANGNGFQNYTSPATEAVTATAPQVANFASYAQYAQAYQTWLQANFNANTTLTPPPLLQPILNGDYYTAYTANYAVYSSDYPSYMNYVAFQTGTQPQVFYQPFAPYAEPGKLPGASAYGEALQNYNAAMGIVASDHIDISGTIYLNGGGTANITTDPNYEPIQAPLQNQSNAYYTNYEDYISEVGIPDALGNWNRTGWLGDMFYRNNTSTGWLGYKPTASDPNVPVAPLPANYATYAAYVSVYETWLASVDNDTILINTGGHPDTPSPLLLPLDNGTYDDYSSNYAEYIAGYGYYDSYINGVRWNSTTAYIYAPFAPADDPLTVIPPALGNLPVADFGPNNNPDDEPVAGNPVSLYVATLLGGSSSSYRLVAGADLTSADPLTVNPGSNGNVDLGGHLAVADTATTDENGNPLSQSEISGRTLLFPTIVRTGTGSIDIAAAGDVDWTDTAAPAAVYTAGEPAPGTSAGTSAQVLRLTASSTYRGELLATGPVQPVDAGDITINAGKNIDAFDEVYDTTGTVTGAQGTYIAQFWWQWMETNNPIDGLSSSINFAAFDQGVMSAGGSVNVLAGGNINELSASLPTTWNISNGAVNTLGGGNLSVSAGGNILGGAYFVANGTGSLTAGGEIGSAFNLSTIASGPGGPVNAVTPMAPLLGYQNTNWTVTARQDANIGGAYDPSYFYLDGVSSGDSQSPSSNSSLSILSTVGNADLDTMTASNSAFLGSYVDGIILPASLSMTALGGGIEIDNSGELYPSVNGQLTLLADQSISFADDTAGTALGGAPFTNKYFGLLDVDPSTLPSPLNPNPTFFSGNLIYPDPLEPTPSGLQRYQHTISHAQNANPVRIYALNGNITDGAVDSQGFYYNELILVPNKPAFVQAGNDIINLSFLGENFYASDVTRIVAGRDIYDPVLGTEPTDPSGAYYLTPALEVAGPGYFDVQAGRNIGPLTSANEAYLVFGNSAAGTGLNQTISTGIETLGDLDNALLPAQSANISILFGVGKGIDDAGFVAVYIDPSAPPIPGVNSLAPELVSYVEQIENDALARAGQNDPNVILTPDQAYAIFEALPQYQQQAFIDQEFFNVLTQVGIDYNNTASPYYHQYARGYEAINTLFPASYGYTQNNLDGGVNGANVLSNTGYFDMRGATVQTQEGGSVDILGPGGEILVGSASAPPYVVSPQGNTVIGPNQQGIITLEQGNVDIFSDQSLLLAQSRVFTEQGGDMTIWSSNGDINAGEGAKTTSVPPTLSYVEDPDAYFTRSPSGEVTGAGIATLQTVPGAPPGNVYLIAPRGTVDAGAAGIRVSGNLDVAALHVLNAFNIQVQGVTEGIPTVVAPNIGALDNASAASGAATKAITATGPGNHAAAPASILIVEIEGYGGGDGEDTTPQQDLQRKNQQRNQRTDNQGQDPHNRYQVVGAGNLTDDEAKEMTEARRHEIGR